MKILLVGDYPDDPRLGSAKVYHKLREELVELGHRCDVLLSPALGARPASPRVRWAVGPMLASRAVRRAFRENGAYDVVDVASAEGAMLGLRRTLGAYRATMLVSRSHGIEHLNFRRMIDDHEWGLHAKPWYRRLWYPAARMSQVAVAARLCDRMIVLNESERDFVVANGWKGAGKVDVVPHGVSSRFLDDAPPPDAERGRGLLFCGSWDVVKGVGYLARAMELLADTGDAPHLTVLGPGCPEEVVLSTFAEAVRPRVTVLPRAGEDEVMRHYREHDALVMTSTYEGFGMVVLEAMSQRLPVVATTVGGAPALLAEGGGVLIPPRQPEAIAFAVRRLMDDPAGRRAIGDRARELARGRSWTETARATLACYARGLKSAQQAVAISGG